MQGRLAAAAASPGLGAVLGWGWGQGWDPAQGWDTSLAHGRCTYLSQTSWKDKVSVLNLKPPGHGTERIAHPNFPPLYLGGGGKAYWREALSWSSRISLKCKGLSSFGADPSTLSNRKLLCVLKNLQAPVIAGSTGSRSP